MNLALTQTCALVGKGDFRPLRRFVRRVLVEIDLAQNRHRVALEQMRHHFALKAGLAAHDEIAHGDLRRAGNERDGRFSGRGFLCRGGGNVAFLCRGLFSRRVGFTRFSGKCLNRGAFGRPRSSTFPARALSAAVLVLFCATATVATISPNVNQQCFFINPKVKF